MLLRFLVLTALCTFGLRLCAQEPFAVSLWSSGADLSPYYRAIVREATDRYRGDGFATVVLARIHYFTLSSGEVVRIQEAHFDSDPFPTELLDLRSSALDGTRASNQAMQRTAGRSAF